MFVLRKTQSVSKTLRLPIFMQLSTTLTCCLNVIIQCFTYLGVLVVLTMWISICFLKTRMMVKWLLSSSGFVCPADGQGHDFEPCWSLSCLVVRWPMMSQRMTKTTYFIRSYVDHINIRLGQLSLSIALYKKSLLPCHDFRSLAIHFNFLQVFYNIYILTHTFRHYLNMELHTTSIFD